MSLLDSVIIVLSRPQEAGNVGAVCRAMMNMGLSRLRLVAPLNMDDAVIRARAVHAAGIWDTAEISECLQEAIADCGIVIGTSRRRGRMRKTITMLPDECARYIRGRLLSPNGSKSAALVFGNERTGLETDELALCSAASHINVCAAFPSLNLSHAVQIYCYELFKALADEADRRVTGTWQPLDTEHIDSLAESVCASLASIGFYKISSNTMQKQFFRDIFSRAGLTQNEARYMHNIFAKAAKLIKGTGEHTAN